MLIRHLTIGGLRAYGPEPLRVDLAPLTLVFGHNSAGKSSLLSVLPILQQTAAHPDFLTMSGDLVEAGTYRMAVHGHDENVRMTLGFGWTGPDGAAHGGHGVFAWDPDTARARRVEMEVDDGTSRAVVTGSRPWAGQDGASVALALAPEFYEVLSRVFFLGPMRARPEKTIAIGHSSGDYVGPAGERMAEMLTVDAELLDRVNAWCDRLGLGYRVRMLAPVSKDIIMSTGDFRVLALEDTRHGERVLVSPRAVGYGVGQLLPLITQCETDTRGMIIIEQPEVHLHPRLQSEVADVFIDTVISGRAQMLIETHSEHLVLRLLRRVREGALNAADLAILYVDVHEDGAAFVRRLEIDESGELVDGWPGGFFDERLAEVLPGFPS